MTDRTSLGDSAPGLPMTSDRGGGLAISFEFFPPRTDKMERDYTKSIPLGRPGEPIELANLASFLLADQCAYITGAIIPIDGGQYLDGAGTFARMRDLDDQDWHDIRARIQQTNARDKADRG